MRNNKDTDGPPACVLCKQKATTANYLGCPRAPKEPPPEKAARRSISARSSRPRIATPERRPDRVTPRPPQNTSTSADDLSQLMSVITVIDTSELRDPRKIPHRREPDGKINLFNRTRLTR
ncbi:hypothetical protein EVAR_5392_1 [Eumeta japonica]|uniref:Nucleic-acid-binding protein from transposon X-element n=1 Tax=Eumeta variegata TaxID=151549 RepID=A0A4C1T807_EUMVA|nr:hypothetical protein EVAR_5392_1 [Eumeta japonica]